jgi:hypothetical protein
MNQDRNVVSVSDNTDIGRGWRVRAFVLPADWNALGRTLAEQRFRSESAARRYARKLARDYDAEIQG